VDVPTGLQLLLHQTRCLHLRVLDPSFFDRSDSGELAVRRFQILLFGLMTALFMWYAGNLLALNICLSYGAVPLAG